MKELEDFLNALDGNINSSDLAWFSTPVRKNKTGLPSNIFLIPLVPIVLVQLDEEWKFNFENCFSLNVFDELTTHKSELVTKALLYIQKNRSLVQMFIEDEIEGSTFIKNAERL